MGETMLFGCAGDIEMGLIHVTVTLKSLAEALLKAQGGAIAVWASSGFIGD
jgi:hypothetical protein